MPLSKFYPAASSIFSIKMPYPLVGSFTSTCVLCRFLEEAEGCTASIGYTLSSGFLSPGSVPAFVASGLTVLGILGLVLTADRLVTMTIGYDGYKQFYKFVWSVHPGQWLCAGSLFFGAVGDLLLSFYLRFYKRTSERAIFYATRKK